MRRHNRQLRAFLLRFPDHIPCLYAVFLRQLVLRQHNAVALGSVAANSNILPLQFWVEHTFNTGIAVVEVTVQHDSLTHNTPSFQ